MTQIEECFFALVRAALKGGGQETAPTPMALTDEAWRRLYVMAQQQSLLGLLFTVTGRMQMPPSVAMPWLSDAEQIRGLNQLLNSEAARLTRLFADKGRRSAILKGQANARLYPDPLSRQPGDIDIWVEGGRESVIGLLREMHLVDELAKTGVEGKASASYHHVHLMPNEQGVTVEVHFRPSSGNFNPFTNRRMQKWLEEELRMANSLQQVEQGFNVPSTRFALVMQLAHLYHHFLSGGIGLRQVCDYYCLLATSTEEDRSAVAPLLRSFGLHRGAGALMWVLHERLALDGHLLLCEPDEWRGERMLGGIVEGGNFGRYAPNAKDPTLVRFAKNKWHRLKMMRFDFWEVLWTEIRYWLNIFQTLPVRIRYRTLSLRDFVR